MPIDAFLEIPEWTAVEEGAGEDAEDIMRFVEANVGDMILEMVGDVVLLRKASMLANSK